MEWKTTEETKPAPIDPIKTLMCIASRLTKFRDHLSDSAKEYEHASLTLKIEDEYDAEQKENLKRCSHLCWELADEFSELFGVFLEPEEFNPL